MKNFIECYFMLSKYFLKSFHTFQWTIADLFVYEVFTNVVLRDPKILDSYPKIAAHRKRVAELPKIKEYLEKRLSTDV